MEYGPLTWEGILRVKIEKIYLGIIWLELVNVYGWLWRKQYDCLNKKKMSFSAGL